ncbi:S41 family peptidase [Flavisolibacter tropicus]|nr:S41 family peptidase [Flavisolibacter tropicus]
MKTLLLLPFLLLMLPGFAFEGKRVDTLPQGYGQRFSKQQIEADLAFMVHAMENAHPNLYHSISKEQYSKLKDSIVAALKDSMTRDEARPSFVKMIAAINEGHTTFRNSLEFVYDINEAKKPVFAVMMESFDGQYLVVKKDYSPNATLQAGDRVIKINGHRVDSLVNRMTGYYGGLPQWRQALVIEALMIDLYRDGVRAPFDVEYVNGKERKKARLEGLPLQALMQAARGNQPVKIPFTFERLENNIGYLNFRDMDRMYKQTFDTFLLKTFTAIQQQPVNGLIVDLRENGGGDSELGDNLLQHITDKPYRMSGGVVWKISQEYKNYIGKMDSAHQASMTHYTERKNGEFLTGGDNAPEKPEYNGLRYKGKVCFLIGNHTFSSANMLAATVMDYKLATLIGEMSGEAPNDYGDIFPIKLPQTGMSCMTSSKQFLRPNGDKNDMNPVLPNIYVKQNAATNEDEVLQRAIQWVKQGK